MTHISELFYAKNQEYLDIMEIILLILDILQRIPVAYSEPLYPRSLTDIIYDLLQISQ